ncbi:transglutaminase domain-containing protein [Flavobacterium faecale]|nr:transglutaminase domain-containing protein [Flavobacterium faecale]
MRSFVAFVCLLISFVGLGQINPKYDVVDKKMAAIPVDFTTTTAKIATYINANFKTDEDKLRAVFYWTATNIDYDVKNMMIDNSEQPPAYKIANTLKTHKGVCIHYAEVFSAITTDLNLKNYIIEGFVKQGGKVSPLAHAWCAVQLDGNWYFVDPTFGAGGILNGKFSKRLNNAYYKVPPSKMALTHLPFDYLWQFLSSPVTFDFFISGKAGSAVAKINFNFEQEIIRYQSLSFFDRFSETVDRIESNGYKLPVITTYLEVMKKNKSAARKNTGVEKMNMVAANYNQAIVLLNDLIFYRNKRFSPSISDEDLAIKGREPQEKLSQCLEDVYRVGDVGEENKAVLTALKSQINEAVRSSEEQNEFVQEYLKRSKIGRKLMFSKGAFFGVPMR